MALCIGKLIQYLHFTETQEKTYSQEFIFTMHMSPVLIRNIKKILRKITSFL